MLNKGVYMNTYKVKISSSAKTHKLGCLVVMAEDKNEALRMCANELSTAVSDFDEPQIWLRGVVYCTTKSAWDGYH